MPAPPSPSTRRRLAAVALLPALALCGGCYNGEALVERVRHDALRHRLEEVDLGRYEITMPPDPVTSATVEVELHVFGSLARYKQAEVEKRLEDDDYLLRHRTLMAVRDSTPDDFTDPDLAELRGRLLAAANSVLDEPVIQSVGFHQVRFMRH